MTIFSSRALLVAALAAIGALGGTGMGSMATKADLNGHLTSLHAKVTLVNGTIRSITLRGVGCTVSMCSRVAVENTKWESMWLDGLTSIQNISHDSVGPVKADFRFKNGKERQVSVVPGNRMLYIQGRFGTSEKLDLASLNKVEFSSDERPINAAVFMR